MHFGFSKDIPYPPTLMAVGTWQQGATTFKLALGPFHEKKVYNLEVKCILVHIAPKLPGWETV